MAAELSIKILRLSLERDELYGYSAARENHRIIIRRTNDHGVSHTSPLSSSRVIFKVEFATISLARKQLAENLKDMVNLCS